VSDWYNHKVQYPWLLPGYNESLSRFPPGFWSQTPQHTNLVESAHVATNQGTGIKLQPLEAIQLYVALAVDPPIVLTFRTYRARDLDQSKALSLAAARETCISVNRNNSDHARMRRSTTRSARRAVTRTHHSELENSIKDTAKELDDVSTRKSTLAQRLKDLKTEKKTLGRAPRNSHSVDRFGTAGSIPRVSSSSVATEDEQDSEGMHDFTSLFHTSLHLRQWKSSTPRYFQRHRLFCARPPPLPPAPLALTKVYSPIH
jgi:hypothetical protein